MSNGLLSMSNPTESLESKEQIVLMMFDIQGRHQWLQQHLVSGERREVGCGVNERRKEKMWRVSP